MGKDESGVVLSIGLLGVANGSLGAYGQFLAALGPAARQDGAAVLRLHPHPEAVSLGPFSIVRLKSSFWHVRASPRAGEMLSSPVPR